MARKSADLLSGIITESAKLTEFEMITLVQYESAKDAYDAQDDETKAALDVIKNTIRTYALAETTDGIEIDEDVLDQALLVLTMQVASDLALLDIKVANYSFPANICVACGSDV